MKYFLPILLLNCTLVLALPFPTKLGIKTDNGTVVVNLVTGRVSWEKGTPSAEVRLFLDQVLNTAGDASNLEGYTKSQAIADWNNFIGCFERGERPAGDDIENARLFWKAVNKIFKP